MKNENGEILRYQVGSDRADVLFSNSDKKRGGLGVFEMVAFKGYPSGVCIQDAD